MLSLLGGRRRSDIDLLVGQPALVVATDIAFITTGVEPPVSTTRPARRGLTGARPEKTQRRGADDGTAQSVRVRECHWRARAESTLLLASASEMSSSERMGSSGSAAGLSAALKFSLSM